MPCASLVMRFLFCRRERLLSCLRKVIHITAESYHTMMDNLRAAANHVVLKILLALIALSFVLTGVGNYLIGGSSDYAAKVNGQVIHRAQLEQRFQSERNRLQQQLGDKFSEVAGNEGYMQQLRQQQLSQLIDMALMSQYVEKLGLTVSDIQVKDAILNNQAFQNEHGFDNNKFLSSVAMMGFTPDGYADALRQQMTQQKLLQGVMGNEFALPGETHAMVALQFQQRDIRLVTIDSSKLVAQQTATDDELKAYYQQNQHHFIAPEQVRVSYIKMDATAMQSAQTVSDAEIAGYYQQNKADFTKPWRKNISIMQFKTEADANAVLQQLKKGADFAELAQQKSTDIISRKNGGNIGWVGPSTLPEDLKQVELSEKGQLSTVIKSSIGYLIVRLNDIQPEQLTPLAEVRSTIHDKLKHEKAIDAFYAMQKKVSDALGSDNESLTSAEQVSGIKAIETGWFSRDTVPEVLNFPPLIQAIFSGNLFGVSGGPGNNSDVMSVDGDRAFVLRVQEHKPEATQPFDQVRDKIAEIVKMQKAQQQARKQGDALLAELKQGDGDAALKAAGLSFGDIKTLALDSEEKALAETVFALPHPQKDKPTYALSQDKQNNIIVISFQDIRLGTLPDADLKAFSQQLQGAYGNINFESLLASLRGQATIKLAATEQHLQ